MCMHVCCRLYTNIIFKMFEYILHGHCFGANTKRWKKRYETHQCSNNNYIASTKTKQQNSNHKLMFRIGNRSNATIKWLLWRSHCCFCHCCFCTYWRKCEVSKTILKLRINRFEEWLEQLEILSKSLWVCGDKRLSGNHTILANEMGESWNTCSEKRIPKKTVYSGNEHNGEIV